MAFPDDCESFFNCEDGKKSHNLTWDQFWKFLIGTDENGCPVLKTSSEGGGGGGAVTLPSTQRTPSRTLNSTPGSHSVAAGSRSVTLETSSDFDGTILGEPVTAGASYTFSVNQNDDTLGAIAYVIVGGSITINKIV